MADKPFKQAVHDNAIMGAEVGGILGVPLGVGLALYGPDELGAILGGVSMAVVDGVGGAYAGYKLHGWKGAVVGGAGGVTFGAVTGAGEGMVFANATVTVATVATVAAYGAAVETIATCAQYGFKYAVDAAHHGLDNIAELRHPTKPLPGK